jgi:hypothetical protein
LTKAKRRAGANTAWIAALKEFNAENTTWCVPKKGNPKKPLPDYRKVMAIKERIEKERLIRKIGKPPQLERVADEGNWPRPIPKKGQTQQQANLQAAAIAADKKRREEEAEGYRLAQEWAREEERRKEGKHKSSSRIMHGPPCRRESPGAREKVGKRCLFSDV